MKLTDLSEKGSTWASSARIREIEKITTKVYILNILPSLYQLITFNKSFMKLKIEKKN